MSLCDSRLPLTASQPAKKTPKIKLNASKTPNGDSAKSSTKKPKVTKPKEPAPVMSEQDRLDKKQQSGESTQKKRTLNSLIGPDQTQNQSLLSTSHTLCIFLLTIQ